MNARNLCVFSSDGVFGRHSVHDHVVTQIAGFDNLTSGNRVRPCEIIVKDRSTDEEYALYLFRDGNAYSVRLSSGEEETPMSACRSHTPKV